MLVEMVLVIEVAEKFHPLALLVHSALALPRKHLSTWR